MRNALLPLGLMVSLGSLSGCGPAPSPTTPKTTESPKPTAKVAGAEEDAAAPGGAGGASRAAADMGPVAEPLIVGMGRWKSPAATMSSLSSCSGAPPQLIEGNSKKLADLILRDSLGGAVDTQELASIVAMDAPIDVAVALDSSGKKRDVFAAISVGLTSLERAKGAIEGRDHAPLVEIAPGSGMWRVGDRDNTEASCAIAAAAGGAPARLICGDRDRDLLALGPYLARNAPLATLAGGDMHGEARFRPLIDRFGNDLRQQLKSLPLIAESQLSIGDPKFDRAVSDAAAGLQGEFTALLGDLDKVSFDVNVDPATCLSTSGSIELRGSASWLAGTIADRTERNGPPPAIFWQLPKDSDMAFYGHGADPARFSGILQTLRSLGEGAMAKMNIGNAADRKALMALLSMPFSKDVNSVSASGHIDAAAADPKKAAGEQQIVDSLMRGWLGWTLVGVDQGPEAVAKIVKDFVAAYTRQAALAAAFDKAQKKEREAQADLLKRGKQLTIEDIEAREKKLPPRSLLTPIFEELDADTALLPTIKTVAAPAALGKGALAVEIKVSGVPSMRGAFGLGRPDGGKVGKKDAIEFVGHILLMVDDKTTWIAIGTDKDELVKRLLAAKGDAPATGKLSSRPSLEVLKNGKFISGGFATLVPLTKAATSVMSAVASTMGSGGVPPEVQEMIRVINTLPHRGEAPVFFTTETTGGGAPKASMSFKVSQAVMEDVGALVMGGLKIASHMQP